MNGMKTTAMSVAVIALIMMVVVPIGFSQSVPDAYAVSIEVIGQGQVAVSPTPTYGSAGPYSEGTATLFYYESGTTWEAEEVTGWSFSHWEMGRTGDLETRTGQVATLSMSPDPDGQSPYPYVVKAYFEESPTYTLTIQVQGVGQVTPGVGPHTYSAGQDVTLVAQDMSGSGYTFDHWNGNVASPNAATTTIAMDADEVVTAVFTNGNPQTFVLTVTKTGVGTVTPAVGQYVKNEGDVVQLQADAGANSNYVFDHWDGDVADPSATTTTITMDGDKTVMAHFVSTSSPRYTLTMAVVGNGATSPSVGPHTYSEGTVVPLTATPIPDADCVFDHWDGYVADPNSPSTAITMDSDKAVTAFFAPVPPPVPANGLDDDVETGPGNWTADSLWDITDTKSSSPTHSWWFGNERTGTYAAGEYSTQSAKSRALGSNVQPMAASDRVYGSLTSAPISLSGYGRQARVSFWYWRSVEQYLDASYDKTYVQVQFGGGWQTVWSRDSQDPSKKAWEEVGLLVDLPSNATQMQVQFVFDSVDGLDNDYAGWFVDDIKVVPSEQGTVVVIPPLTNGTVGKSYGPVQLSARGGVAPYTWSWTNGVPGLSLDQRSGAITGTPTTAGDYSAIVIATDAAGSTGTAIYTIHISDTTTSCTLLTEDFSDPTGWTMTSLWHTASGLSCLTYASLVSEYAYFGKSSGCSYDTGAAVKGELHSPAIDVPSGVQNVVIEFDEFRYVEGYSQAYDKTWLEVSFDNSTWETVWYRDASYMSPEGAHVQVVRTVPSGATQVWIRFQFNSVDSYYNDYPGWAIDNVQVLDGACVGSAAASAVPMRIPPMPARRDQISISNWPNPVTDIHTTTFTVRGASVEAMKIQIFNLSGALVYEEEVSGNELQWHTDNNYGEYLANGVYQYRALVKVDNAWITTGVQSVVILR